MDPQTEEQRVPYTEPLLREQGNLRDVHGASLNVRCTDAVLARDVQTLLSQFRPVGPRTPTAALLEVRAVPPGDPAGLPSPEAELLCEGDDAGGVAWPWRLLRDRGRTVVVWDGRARLQIDAARGDAVAWIVDPAGQRVDGRASVIFFGVTSLLRRSSLFT